MSRTQYIAESRTSQAYPLCCVRRRSGRRRRYPGLAAIRQVTVAVHDEGLAALHLPIRIAFNDLSPRGRNTYALLSVLPQPTTITIALMAKASANQTCSARARRTHPRCRKPRAHPRAQKTLFCATSTNPLPPPRTFRRALRCYPIVKCRRPLIFTWSNTTGRSICCWT